MIKKLSKIFKTSNNLHSITGNVLYAGFSMILFVFMLRTVDKELYGRWIIVLTTFNLLDIFRVGLTGTGAIRAISTSTGVEQYRSIAASYYLSIFISIILTCIFIPSYLFLHSHFENSYYIPVLFYYPLMAFSNLAHTQATNYSQGIINFKRVLIIRSTVGFLNLIFISLYIYFFNETLEGIVFSYCLSDIVTSLFVIGKKWDGNRFLKYFDIRSIKELLNFGKYSTASLIGSNLLRSSDTFILSLSPFFGAAGVAIYSIPMKFVEMIEIPLRSLTSTAFPKFSLAFQEGKEKFIDVFSNYLTLAVIMLVPVVIFIPFLSEPLLLLFGGKNYIQSIELQKNILYVLTFYIFFLPFDRFSGISLMSFNRPDVNFLKVLVMLICNIIFDVMAVFVFKSLVLVALGSVFFTIAGIILGFIQLNKYTNLTLERTFKELKYRSVFIIKNHFLGLK